MLGAGDIDLCQKAKPYFSMLPIYCDMASQQFKEQFPNGIENTPNTYDFTILVNTILAEQFIGGQISAETIAVLDQFRKDFASQDAIKTGKHFNVRTLIAALLAYNDNLVGNVSHIPSALLEMQRALFWCQVIGYLECLLPACYLQAIRQGTVNLMGLGQPLIRFDFNPNSKLGCHFAIYSGDGRELESCRWPIRNECDSLLNYVEQKEGSLSSLRRGLSKVDKLATGRRSDWFVVDCESDRSTHQRSAKSKPERCVIS